MCLLQKNDKMKILLEVSAVKDIWTFEVKQTRTIITLTDVLTAEAL